MKKKAIICLAAGNSQLNYFRLLKKNKIEIISIDKNKNAKGFKFANVKIVESIHNYKSIIKRLDKIRNQYNFLGLLNGSNGFAEISQLKILEYLNLCKIKNIQIENIFNKKKIYQVLNKSKILTPKIIHKNKLKFPLIMKPEFTEVGKIQVNYAKNMNDYKYNLKKNYNYKIKKKIFLTNFIEGKDISFIGYIKNTVLHELAFIEEKSFFDKKNRLNSKAVLYPCNFLNKSLKIKILQITKRIIDLFNLDNTPIAINYRFDEKKKNFYFIELHICLVGDSILDKLLTDEKNSSYNWYIDLLNNKTIKKLKFKKKTVFFDDSFKETSFKKIFVHYPKTYRKLKIK